MDSPINNAEDLSKQMEIEYGTKSDGSTASFFKNSKVPTYQKMWASMIERKSNTETQDEGINRVISKLPLFELAFGPFKRKKDLPGRSKHDILVHVFSSR